MSNAFVPSSFFGSSVAPPRSLNGLNSSTQTLRHVQPRLIPAMSGNVLIVNTKGGGHGHIGLYLARTLLEDGHKVHIHQVGKSNSSEPMKQYPTLEKAYTDRFSVAYGSLPPVFDKSYTAIYDNNAKSEEDIAPVIETARDSGAQVFYVSSAGSYKYDGNKAPHEIKDAASGSTIEVEDAIKTAGVCSANFRPIYIIGQHTSKREYIDFFFNRLVRDRPIPIPGSGDELTSITDVRDIATLLASAIGKDLKDNTFNCVNTRAVTFDAMIQMCAEACGRAITTIKYDPKKMEKLIDGFTVKEAFPFRPRHFFADPLEAQRILGWEPLISGSRDGLSSSIKLCYKEYVDLGLDKADVDFSLDDKIIANV